MFSGPSLSARLANIQHIPVLMAATVASDKPIEPYLIKDILKMSFESGQARGFLQQYLLNQLVTSRNVYVKLKVLKLLEELLEKGHIEFKQNLRKQPEPLNEASRLRAIHTKDGGIVTECSRIRDLSNKLLEKLYSDTPELQPKRYPPPDLRSTTSEGSSSSSRMEGVGNSSFTSSRTSTSSSTTDKLKALFGSSTKSSTNSPLIYDENYATMDPVPHNVHAPAAGGGWRYRGGAGYAPHRFSDHGVPEGAPHRSGEAGGGWGGDNQPLSSSSSYVPQSQPPAVEETLQQEEQYTNLSTAESEDQNTEQERRLVDDITAPGGVKAAPPRDSLHTFISRCKVLDSLAVVEFLRQKLQETEQTQVVLRTLIVVEAMLKSDIPDVFSQMDLLLHELHTLTSSTNTTIRAKAKKIMQQLAAVEEEGRRGIPSSEGGGVSDPGTSRDILDLGGEGGDEHTNEVLPPSVAGLFAGLSVSGQPPSNVPPNAAHSGPPTAVVPAVQRHTQQKGPGRTSAVEERQGMGPLGDLLGLSSSQLTPTITEVGGEGKQGEEGEPSLMVLEDERDETFDPLTKTESVGSKSNTVTESLSLGNPQTAPPPSLGNNNGVMTELSELDLTITSSGTGTRFQNGIGTGTLQPHTSLNSLPLVPTATLGGPTPLLPGVAPSQPAGVGGVYGQVMMPGVGVYMAPGSVPYGIQPGLPPQQALYTNAQGAPVMYMNQPRLGGYARPVQRPQVTATDSESQSSFEFLSKSSKGAAFDFVKEEIDSAKKK